MELGLALPSTSPILTSIVNKFLGTYPSFMAIIDIQRLNQTGLPIFDMIVINSLSSAVFKVTLSLTLHTNTHGPFISSKTHSMTIQIQAATVSKFRP